MKLESTKYVHESYHSLVKSKPPPNHFVHAKAEIRQDTGGAKSHASMFSPTSHFCEQPPFLFHLLPVIAK